MRGSRILTSEMCSSSLSMVDFGMVGTLNFSPNLLSDMSLSILKTVLYLAHERKFCLLVLKFLLNYRKDFFSTCNHRTKICCECFLLYSYLFFLFSLTSDLHCMVAKSKNVQSNSPLMKLCKLPWESLHFCCLYKIECQLKIPFFYSICSNKLYTLTGENILNTFT